MRGTDLTPEQLEAANVFIAGRLLCDVPKPDQTVTHRYEDLVRLVAWYGAVRAEGNLRGIGDVDHPAVSFAVKE